jgi:membrane-associated protease RseP (regulator of RpoE activity)
MAGGPAFSATLMAILVCHEMGHYVAARRYGLDVSLPYFIPLPPMITLGTLGAVIRMKAPISDRNQLLVVGAAGPLAGLVVAIPALVIGLQLSSVGPIPEDGALEGNSIFYGLTKYALWAPAATEPPNRKPVNFCALSADPARSGSFHDDFPRLVTGLHFFRHLDRPTVMENRGNVWRGP